MPITTVNRDSAPPEPQLPPEELANTTTGVRPTSAAIISRLKVAALLATCVLVLTTSPTNVGAQTLRLHIAVSSVAPAKIRVVAEGLSTSTVLSFPNAYGGVLGLARRIDNLEAKDANGGIIPVRKLAVGEFKTAAGFMRLSYDVNVSEPARPADMAHVSWLNQQHGLLMLADLLPQYARDPHRFATTLVEVDVPPGWTVSSNIKKQSSEYATEDPDKAVFLIGPSVHQKTRRIASTDFSIFTSGQWPISDDDLFKVAEPILQQYSKITGAKLKGSAVLMLIPYPEEAGPYRWSAETRDNDVVLLLGRGGARDYVLARLGIVLSHELFHLWVPGSLKLDGDYDWFFEGFTLYEALRLNLYLGLISFQDFLDTIARVYDSHLSSADHNGLSLLEASERRWTTRSSLVYDKGMLVAFMYDLMARERSGCKASIDDLYKQLFQVQSTGQQSANETIIRLMSRNGEMESFVKAYIQNPGSVDLQSALLPFGLFRQSTFSQSNATRIDVKSDLSKQQRKMLGCLGLQNVNYLRLRLMKN